MLTGKVHTLKIEGLSHVPVHSGHSSARCCRRHRLAAFYIRLCGVRSVSLLHFRYASAVDTGDIRRSGSSSALGDSLCGGLCGAAETPRHGHLHHCPERSRHPPAYTLLLVRSSTSHRVAGVSAARSPSASPWLRLRRALSPKPPRANESSYLSFVRTLTLELAQPRVTQPDHRGSLRLCAATTAAPLDVLSLRRNVITTRVETCCSSTHVFGARITRRTSRRDSLYHTLRVHHVDARQFRERGPRAHSSQASCSHST